MGVFRCPSATLLLASVVAACGGDDGPSAQTTMPLVPTTGDAPSTTTGPEASGTTGGNTESPTTNGPTDGPDEADGTTLDSSDGTTTSDPDLDGEPGEFTLTFDGRDYRL